jgi:hypothetical protein
MKIIRAVGGLGSQMLAYSLAYSMRKRLLCEKIVCDFSAYHLGKRYDHNGSEINRVFGLLEESIGRMAYYPLYSDRKPLGIIRETAKALGLLSYIKAEDRKYNYDSRVFAPSRGKISILTQCWSSWRYLEGAEDEVRNLFRFPWETISAQNKAMLQAIESCNSVSIHIRRGDYLHSKILGGMVGPSYYEEAVQVINNEQHEPLFFIFSDDSQYAQREIQPLVRRSILIDWNKDSESFWDMALMAKCKHHIIPNSSFGWWGAFLASNEEQLVVAPRFWANPQYADTIEIGDMNLPRWRLIDNNPSTNGAGWGE